MTGVWLMSYIALWIIVALEALVIVLLVRQTGNILLSIEMLERSTPSRLERRGLKPGVRAPDFTLKDLGGEEISLRDYLGRRVLLIFSHPNCKPCAQLIPDLNRLCENYGDKQLQLLMISNDDVEDNQRLFGQHNLRFPILLQEHWRVSKEYGTFITPFAFVIDEQGTIKAKGMVNGYRQIEELLKT